MGAEIALLGTVVIRVDENRVVGAGGDTSLATDADGFVEVDDPIGSPVHRTRGAGRRTWRRLALVAARHLKSSMGIGKLADVYVFDVGPRHREWNFVLRLASGGTGVATDALLVIDDLPPPNLWCF